MRRGAYAPTVPAGRGVAGRTNSAKRLRYGFRIPLLHNHEGTSSSYVVLWDAMWRRVAFMENNDRLNISAGTRKLVYCALLTALGVVLGGMSIPAMPLGAYTLKIGFGVLPVIIAAVMFGPLYGGAVGGLTDLLQALIFPKGAYMPWFTVIGVLFGVIPGLFFAKRQQPTLKRIFAAVFTGQMLCSVVLNTLLLMWLYGSPYHIVYSRLANQMVMIPVYTIVVYWLIKCIRRAGVI